MTIAIIIPLYNQLHYTRLCLESIASHTRHDIRLIVIDNASSDGTAEFLATLDSLTVIHNPTNLGCAGAWNQGVKAASGAEWMVILNNDVIVSPEWLTGLLEAAADWQLDIVCPAIREGACNYDVDAYSAEFVSRMHATIRRGAGLGVCFMVHRRVFETIGGFDETFRIGQYEDADFFLRARRAHFRIGSVGRSFLHHFGAITQRAMNRSQPTTVYALENRARFIRKWRRNGWQWAWSRNRDKLGIWLHGRVERLLYRHTLIEKWLDGRLHYF
jgi:N-acetylglucosaminyl-diphospho-decaprenol L-rhamnosyltransferase